jgi:hypothetical protein
VHSDVWRSLQPGGDIGSPSLQWSSSSQSDQVSKITLPRLCRGSSGETYTPLGRYITAQILGGFIASMFVYWQWNTLIKVSMFFSATEPASAAVFLENILLTCSQEAEAALRAAGLYDTENFSSVGPAGIFALYANPAAPLGQVFLNEFVSVCGRTSLT